MSVLRPIAKLLLSLTRALMNPFVTLCFRIYYRKLNKSRPLPPITNELLLLPAHKLAAKLRKKEITSTQLVQIFIDRIKEVQPLLNCVVDTCFEKAYEEAQEVDRILALNTIPERYNETNAPLLGVPFSCKESLWCKGMPNATGLIYRSDFRAPEDCDIVKNMRKAGAILLCVTNTSELCMWMESRNPLRGITNNPYNLSRIVGGSSGGEGCLLASGGSVIGIGSDIGGSIRIPSYFNGIFGHKSSYGLISNRVQYPPINGELIESMLSSGPMCRYASDLRLLFKIHAGDLYKQVAVDFESKVDLSQLNYYVIYEFNDCLQATPLSDECKNALKRAVHFLETSLNVKVQVLDVSVFRDAYWIWSAMMNNGKAKNTNINDLISSYISKEFHPFRELIKSIFVKSNHSLPLTVYALLEKHFSLPEPEKYVKIGKELAKHFDTILGKNSIILSPGYPTVAPFHHQPVITNTYDFIYFGVYNALGLPSTNCPLGLSEKSGLPLGMQIVSNKNCDHLTISVAEYFEKNSFGWAIP